MLEAFFWGFVAGFALLVGAVIGLRVDVPDRVLGAVLAFGSGVLISAAAYDLTAEAFDVGGVDATAFGLAAGSVSFFAANTLLARRSSRKAGESDTATPLVVGAVLDGIPESAAIGISLIDGSGVSVAVVVAVFLSNVPEALSASAEMRARGSGFVLRMWSIVVLASALAAAIGYGALSGATGNALGFINAFAAGAILTMLADSMIPEALEKERRSFATGLLTTLGFALAALLTTLE